MIEFLDEEFSQLNDYLKNKTFSQIFILVDENTHEHCLPQLLGNLETSLPYEIIELEPGEELKNLESAAMLWSILSEFKADRKSLLINLGGGVISDLGGFVASTYKRGIPFVHIPTTLLSMCDASIGGKTGIDHGFLKNVVGTFSSAEKIFVYPNFLSTLPKEEKFSGLAEMLKHGLIADKNHWQVLSKLDLKKEQEIPSSEIKRSMEIKNEIVQQDFEEKNIRKLLNFGHTIGHAIESLLLASDQKKTHGHCVAVGMLIESLISMNMGLLSKEDTDEITTVLTHFYKPITLCSWESLLKYMQNDKKNEKGEIRFTLLEGIGKAVFDQNVPLEVIKNAISTYENTFS